MKRESRPSKEELMEGEQVVGSTPMGGSRKALVFTRALSLPLTTTADADPNESAHKNMPKQISKGGDYFLHCVKRTPLPAAAFSFSPHWGLFFLRFGLAPSGICWDQAQGNAETGTPYRSCPDCTSLPLQGLYGCPGCQAKREHGLSGRCVPEQITSVLRVGVFDRGDHPFGHV